MRVFPKRFGVLILANVLAIGLAGCGVEREAETTPAGDGPAAKAKPQPAEAPEAEIPAPGQLPSDFPPDVPPYPGATVQQSMSVPDHSMFVTFLTTASSQEVHNFYREHLQKRGWSISQESDDERHLTAQKEGRTVSILIMASGAQTEIGIAVQEG